MSDYKSFVTVPSAAFDKKTGEEIALTEVYSGLVRDTTSISDAVEAELLSPKIAIAIAQLSKERLNPRTIGQRLNISLPEQCYPEGKSGKSRFDRIFLGKLVSEAVSWESRMQVCEGDSEKFVSSGWKRTANSSRPKDIQPSMNLAHAGDDRYVKFRNNPLKDESATLDMEMVVNGRWVILCFPFDHKRFKNAEKICFPIVYVSKSGIPKFSFPVAFPEKFPSISQRFVVGVDVGKVIPAAVSVRDSDTNELVATTTLSRRVHSLANKINACDKQKNVLRNIGRDMEASLHREASSRKKREMAILISQEIAAISHKYDNAVVVFEDLSWIQNTMENGRWNRGEIVRWTQNQVKLNGGRVIKHQAAWSSSTCHCCGVRSNKPNNKREFVCLNPNCVMIRVFQDRDINAAGEMARRVADRGTIGKIATTREATRAKYKHSKRVKRHTTKTRESLRHPGRDRTKNGPTPKRPNRHWKIDSERQEVNCQSTPDTLLCTVLGDAMPQGYCETETGCLDATVRKRRRIVRVANSRHI